MRFGERPIIPMIHQSAPQLFTQELSVEAPEGTLQSRFAQGVLHMPQLPEMVLQRVNMEGGQEVMCLSDRG